MADEEWGDYEKKDWVEEVGEKKMAAVLIVLVEQAGLCTVVLISSYCRYVL